jgi:DNA-directed RNA polymerase subunit RPC12/RpoP
MTYKCSQCSRRFSLNLFSRRDSPDTAECPYCHGKAMRCAHKDGCRYCGGVLRADGRCYGCGRLGRALRA